MLGKKFYYYIGWVYALILTNFTFVVSCLPIGAMIFLLEIKPRYAIFYFVFTIIGLIGFLTLIASCRKMSRDQDIYHPLKLYFRLLKSGIKEMSIYALVVILVTYPIMYYVYLIFQNKLVITWIYTLLFIFFLSLFELGALVLSHFEGTMLSVLRSTFFSVLKNPMLLLKTMTINLALLILIYYLPLLFVLGGASTVVLVFYKQVGKEFVQSIATKYQI